MLFFQYIGRQTVNFFQKVGLISIFIIKIINGFTKPPFYSDLVLQQIVFIGYFSLPLVAMTTFFSGAVLALHTYITFSKFPAENSLAMVIAISITRELSPVLTGLMVAGKVGASISAEIATMKITEQVDALFTLCTEPVKYLAVPRIIASIMSVPCLVLIGDIIGITGGYLVSVYKLGFNKFTYIKNTVDCLKSTDVLHGLFKALVFGFIVVMVSCYQGFCAKKGAKEVGIASTNAVAFSSALILVINYFFTELLFA